jgi:hypothetical protein
MGVGGVFFWVNKKAKKRMDMIEEQLARCGGTDGAQLARRPPVFIRHRHRVAKEVPDPLGTEFGMIADEAAYGRDDGRNPEGSGRTYRHAGFALSCRGGDHPAASRAATWPKFLTVWPR